MRMRLEALVRRGSIVESRHELDLALAGPGGRLEAATDGADRVTTFRSAAKPFQLLPLVERGHADRWGFGDADLALMAASHTGSAEHVAGVRRLLDRIGLGPDDLACGYHEPEDPESLARLRRGAESPSPLYNNCSGKHAGMLALARAEGWPVEGYHRPEHPVQQLALGTVADLCGVDAASVATAVDGCSVVVFAVPLRAMARGYAVLAAAARRPGDDARSRALARIARAMMAHPRLVEGRGRVSTELMEAAAGKLLAKCGAEGLQLVAWPERALGLAIKCRDGATRATGPAVVAALERFGALEPDEIGRLSALRQARVRNAAGLDVGDVTAALHEAATA